MSLAGGVLKNAEGMWVSGFSQRMLKSPIDIAELRGAFTGMKLALSIGVQKLNVETNSVAVFEIFNKTTGSTELHPLAKSCVEMKARFQEFEASHIFRESNKCADIMAKLGRRDLMGTVIMDEPPREVADQIRLEKAGASMFRGSRATCSLVPQITLFSST